MYKSGAPGMGVSCLASRGLDSWGRCLGPSAPLVLSAGAVRRGGLLVRVVKVSRVVTWTFSVRRSRSSNELLAERRVGFGWPEVERLWAVVVLDSA